MLHVTYKIPIQLQLHTVYTIKQEPGSCNKCSNYINATYTRMIEKKNFKQGIGIAEKSQETRRDCWGANVNHKFLLTQ